MTLKHQPDQADFKAILPEDIDWRPFPAFPADVKQSSMSFSAPVAFYIR